MKRNQGFGIIEVIIAIAVLAIGVLAAAQLQVSALRASSDAEGIRGVTRVAETELAWQQYAQVSTFAGENPSPVAASNPYAYDCASLLPDDYNCTFEVKPCNFVAGVMTCEQGISAPLAYEVAVTAVDPRGNDVTLRSITTGTYVAGTAGTSAPSTSPPASDPPPPPADEPTTEPTPPPTEEPTLPPEDTTPCVPAGKSGKCKKN